MRHHYFLIEEKPPTLIASVLLLLMLLALILSPQLAFAESLASEPMPRYLLSPDDISSSVARELEKAGYGDTIEASLHVEDPSTVFGADEPITVSVKSLDADLDSRRWSANILFKNGERILTALPMKGRFDTMVDLPVLTRALAGGQVIEKDDITMQRFPTHYQRAGVVHEVDKLVGMSVKRNISKDRPIREHEISMPVVVKKGDLLNLTYSNNSLTITTTGQAMADASEREVIQIKNVNSDKIIRATIEDAKTASVVPLTQTSSIAGGKYEYR